MNSMRRVSLCIVCLILLCLLNPIEGKAAGLSIGNLLGIEEQVVLMNSDINFLNEEIERLRKECE